MLSVEADKLQKQWQSFRETSDKDEQLDTKRISPTISSAIQVITDMSNTWETKRWTGKRGKAKSYFHRLCNTLDAHSNMLDIVPRSNEYVSLFAGTLTTIIKASVNHEAIAEDLTQAFCEISELVAGCDVDLKLFATEDMQHAVAKLYAHIFLFLNDAMSWYAKKRRRRVLDSLNEKFRETFEESVENIRSMASTIQIKARQGSAAEQRATRLQLESMRQDLRIGLEGWQRDKADMQALAMQMQQHMLSQTVEWGRQGDNLKNLQQSLNLLLTDQAGAYVVQLNGKSGKRMFESRVDTQ